MQSRCILVPKNEQGIIDTDYGYVTDNVARFDLDIKEYSDFSPIVGIYNNIFGTMIGSHEDELIENSDLKKAKSIIEGLKDKLPTVYRAIEMAIEFNTQIEFVF